VNPVFSNFVAAESGDVTVYFAGSDAGYTSELGLLVDGVPTGITGLNNHTSALGQAFNLGFAPVGASLTFFINVLTTGETYFTDPARNPDAVNHAYAEPFAGGTIGGSSSVFPAGTYIGFEDIGGGGDLDYNDVQFIFQNVAVPGPIAGAGLPALLGLAGAWFVRRRKQKRAAA